MIVCVCHNVSDRTVRACARAGACTADDVMKKTCAGTRCGSCVDTVVRIVDEERDRRDGERIAAK